MPVLTTRCRRPTEPHADGPRRPNESPPHDPRAAILRLQQAAGNAAVSRLIQRDEAAGGTGVAHKDWLDGEANDVHNAFVASELQGVAKLNGYSLEDIKGILERFPEHDRKHLADVLRDPQVQAAYDAARIQLALRSAEVGGGWHADRATEVHDLVRSENWVEAYRLLNGFADTPEYPDLLKVLQLLAPAHLRALIIHLDQAQGVDRPRLEQRMKEVTGGPRGGDPSKTAEAAFMDLTLDAVPGATYDMRIKAKEGTVTKLDLGHVWIEVAERQYPYREESCGFYPTGGLAGAIADALAIGPGVLEHPDHHALDKDETGKREKEVDRDALFAVAGLVRAYQSNPYSLALNNCGDFAVKAWALATGENLDNQDSIFQLRIPGEIAGKLEDENKYDKAQAGASGNR